ncbi:uncharacterized protein EAF01_003484 [Botrytis porri]|uniref:Uncharacterized protein n=1 Tax=Botrytis porri TaxID=87229 RepID=A0A4Z1KXT9_9HELO|nr:uncharacterized protein EAF01_003484 [Botrytis porri]KAF7909766.1 hypothetical protein EAF01_003484 [Botrytis porri]TGO89415.1 hypothetical protein BPOR_0111g00250 [Botrytis porri]
MAAAFTLNEASLDRDSVTKAQFETIVRKLLQEISYKPLVMHQDVDMESFVLEQLLDVARDQHLDLQKLPQIAKLSVQTVHLIYPWHKKELLKLIAIYTGYFYVIEITSRSSCPNCEHFVGIFWL